MWYHCQRFIRRRFALLLCCIGLFVATGYPLLLLFAQSVFPEILGWQFDGFLSAYQRLWATPDLVSMLRNSILWGLAVTGISWVFGIPSGYLLGRCQFPGKTLARISLLVPIMTPPYIAALAYILILQPNGFFDHLFFTLPDFVRAGFFSFWGVALVMALASFGYVALAVEAALFSVPGRLDDAAAILGASWKTRMRRITLPLLLPAILNSGLLVLLESLSNFGVPAVLGTRSNLPLLPAEIFFLVTSWPVDLPLATSLSSLLCLFALGTFYLSRWLGSRLPSGNTRPSQTGMIPLGRLAITLCWVWFGSLFFLSALAPGAAMVLTSLADQWGAGFPDLTLRHFAALFEPGSRGLGALTTSLGLAVSAATICIVLGSLIAFVNFRSTGWLQKALEAVALLPRIIPKIVIAVALILAWNAPWVPFTLYNTVWMLLLAYVVIYITDALNYSNATLRSMSPNLENAGAILGASPTRVFFKIVLPQLRPALFAAWLTTFIVCMRELVASILLLPPGIDTTATFIFNQFEQGDISQAMAMATVTILISTAVLCLFRLKSKTAG